MVESLYFVPDWFYTIDIGLGILFTILTGIVALYALRIYNLTEAREFRLFGISFVCLSASYAVRIGLNAFLTTFVASQGIFRITDINLFSKSIIFVYVILFISSYVTLAYTTLKVKGNRTYLLMLIPSIIAFTFSWNKSLTVYLITSLFLLAILYHYIRLYLRAHERRRLAMLIAISLLLASNIIFMFVADYAFYQGYIVSSIGELIAYVIMALTLYRITENGKKEK